LEKVFYKDLFENERRKEKFCSLDKLGSNRECLKFDKVGKHSSSTKQAPLIIINTVHHIKKMHCQQFTLKYITLPYQVL